MLVGVQMTVEDEDRTDTRLSLRVGISGNRFVGSSAVLEMDPEGNPPSENPLHSPLLSFVDELLNFFHSSADVLHFGR